MRSRTGQLSVIASALVLLFAFGLSPVGVVGCHKNNKILGDVNKFATQTAKVKEAVYNALSTSTNTESRAWREFLAHWPDAKKHFGSRWDESLKGFRTGITASAIIEERYVLRINMDIEVSEDCQQLVFRNLQFHFFEVKAVRLPPEGPKEGGTMTTFQPDQKHFSIHEWRQLVSASWDFSKIGIKVVSNAPIPNIRYVPNL